MISYEIFYFLFAKIVGSKSKVSVCLLFQAKNKLGRAYNPGRPLAMEERLKILQLYEKGHRISHIARMIGVTHSCVSKIMTRFTACNFKRLENPASPYHSLAVPVDQEFRSVVSSITISSAKKRLKRGRNVKFQIKFCFFIDIGVQVLWNRVPHFRWPKET